MSAVASQPISALRTVDLAELASLRDKQRAGGTLTEAERAKVGTVLSAAIDAFDIEGNESLRRILKLIANKGKLGAAEQVALADGLQQITDLPKNPQLAAHLKAVRAKGFATEADVLSMTQLAKKLSVDEENAIYATLASVSLAQGISDKALKIWDEYADKEVYKRVAFGQKTGWWARAKSIAVMAAAIAGTAALTALIPWATVAAVVGGTASTVLQLGMFGGSFIGLRAVNQRIGKTQGQNVAAYGVLD